MNQLPKPKINSYKGRIAFGFKSYMWRKYSQARTEVLLLLNSRILQTLMLLPLLYVSYSIGRYAYISYLSY